MSKMDIFQAMQRIKAAPPQSRIAIFRMNVAVTDGIVNAVFANTVVSQQKIRSRDLMLIGVYDNTFNMVDTEEEIRRKSREHFFPL